MSLTAEALTGEPNHKEPTFNEETSPDNDEVTALDLIIIRWGFFIEGRLFVIWFTSD